MVPPQFLCKKHLLGEHGELHKFLPSFIKKHNMSKRILLGQIDPAAMQLRHEELAEELVRRGYNHNSPYIQPDILYITEKSIIDIGNNIKDLCQRCEECKKRIKEEKDD